MNLEAYKGQLVKLLLDDSDESRERGVMVASNDECVLLASTCDFTVDGYAIIPTRKIIEVVRGENEKFSETILALKGIKIPTNSPMPIGGFTEIFKHFSNTHELVMFHLEDAEGDYAYLGRVIIVDATTVVINYLDPCGTWDGKQTVAYENLVKVDFASDYTESFKLWLKHKEAI